MNWGLAFTLVLFTAAGAAADEKGGFFERIPGGSGNAWRTRGAGEQVLILPDGFAVRDGESWQRFRWDASMRLKLLENEGPMESNAWQLSGKRSAEPLQRAAGVRAHSRDGQTAVVYYYGSRGLEFDVELARGARQPQLLLESLDVDLALSEAGLSAKGKRIALKPAAWVSGQGGEKHIVSASWRLIGTRRLLFKAGAAGRRERLVIDPVMTYATYLAGTGSDTPLGMRELPDGTILLAGNTTSLDLPQGVELNGIAMQLAGIGTHAQCFVARLDTANKKIDFVSYFGGPGFTSCGSMDVDSSGRILLAGVAEGSPAFTTPNAPIPMSKQTLAAFLARITADGKTLDFSTYLGLECQNAVFYMAAGPTDTAYITDTCSSSIAGPQAFSLRRYNMRSGTFDEQITVVPAAYPRGIQVSPSGSVYIFGQTTSQTIPQKNPISSPPTGTGATAGYLLAYSPDFQTLQFGSYLGGARVDSLIFNPDGSFWIAGQAGATSIPSLQPVRPVNSPYGPSPFAILTAPGEQSFRKGFLAGYDYGLDSIGPVGSLILADGRYCLLTDVSAMTSATPGGAALGAASTVPILGCLNDQGSDFQMLTPVGTVSQSLEVSIAVASRAGGVWSWQAADRFINDVIPAEYKSTAIQPFRPAVSTSGPDTNTVLRYIDLNTPAPVLVSPSEVQLSALQANITGSVDLAGRDFAIGMQLEIDGTDFPLTVYDADLATFNYKSPSSSVAVLTGSVVNLPAGTYSGRLVIPGQSQTVASQPFTVVISNLPPAFQPFTFVSSPATFSVAQPFYGDSQVLWNGQALATTTTTGSVTQVQIPASLAQPGAGEFTLVNQPPGGGVQRQPVTLNSTGGVPISPLPSLNLTRVPADQYQADRVRKLLYTVVASGANFNFASYSLPEAQPLQSGKIALGSATVVVDFRISTDGAWLYMTDDLMRVFRLRTDTLQLDVQFQVHSDALPAFSATGATNETRHSLRMLDGAPESVLFVTPGGQLVIYDRDQPRPYTTVEFPSPDITVMTPVLATSDWIYAVQRPYVYNKVSCVVRYPIDFLGFGTPEDFCNIGENWGKFPEMTSYAGTLVLKDDFEAFALRLQPDLTGTMVLPWAVDPTHNLVNYVTLIGFEGNNQVPMQRLDFTALDTGEPEGHFPPATVWCYNPDNYPVMCPPDRDAYPSTAFILDESTMLVLEGSPNGSRVAIVPQWPQALEAYPGNELPASRKTDLWFREDPKAQTPAQRRSGRQETQNE